VKGCPATINTRNNIPVGFGRSEHNHDSDQATIDAKQLISMIRGRSKDECLPIPSIYEEEVVKLRNSEWNDDTRDMVQQLPTFASMKSSLYRARRKDTPPLPQTRQVIELTGKWTQTTSGEDFLLFDDGHDMRIIAFSTKQNLVDL